MREVPTGKVKWYDAEKGFGFVTQDGGAEAFESDEGKYLYFVKGQDAGVWRKPTTGGAEELVTAGGRNGN